MTTSTRQMTSEEVDSYVVQGEPNSATLPALPQMSSGTLARMTRNTMLPLLFGIAAVGAPVPVRRVFSGASVSRSVVSVDPLWLVDEFVYTTEPVDLDQVRALNALLALPAAGTPPDHP